MFLNHCLTFFFIFHFVSRESLSEVNPVADTYRLKKSKLVTNNNKYMSICLVLFVKMFSDVLTLYLTTKDLTTIRFHIDCNKEYIVIIKQRQSFL